MNEHVGRWRATACVAIAVLAGGCALQRPDSSGLLEPYRTDLPQGNYVTREMVAQVRAGLSREQVRAIMGAPLLNSLFREDRWDYVFRYQRPNRQSELRRVVVRFKDDRVTAVEADALPEREDSADPALPGYRPPAVAQDKAATGAAQEGAK